MAKLQNFTIKKCRKVHDFTIIDLVSVIKKLLEIVNIYVLNFVFLNLPIVRNAKKQVEIYLPYNKVSILKLR